MTKKEIIKMVSRDTGIIEPHCREIVDSFLRILKQCIIRHYRIDFRGLGVFKVKHHKGYKTYNPLMKEDVTVQDRWLPVFQFSKKLIDKVKVK